MKNKVLLVDDEPLAITLLQNHLAAYHNFEVIGVAHTAIRALEFLRTHSVDLLFCDIKMPTVSGIELLKTLKNPPKTIITTAHRDFALEGYELDILDYLLKPITADRFMKAIEKYLRTLENASIISEAKEVIKIKVNNTFHILDLANIYYIESQKDYVKIQMSNGQLLPKLKISDLEKELKSKGFLRVHRSFLINSKHLTSFTAFEITLGTFKVPIGQQYKQHCLLYLENL